MKLTRREYNYSHRLGEDPVTIRATFSYVVIFVLNIIFSFGVSTSPVLANPTDGQVEAGSATISAPAPNTVQINQASDKAIINWQSFNIGPGEKTQFVQPSASSVTLNRINPNQGASQIFGNLTSNGQIILVNQAGIFFASGAHVDVGGIIASTSDITNQNFLAGVYIFDQPSSYAGSIINEGVIIASDNGLVAFLGTGVSNRGVIQAKLGSVILASGSQFTITFASNQLISFTVDGDAMSAGVDQQGTALKNGVSNSGQVLANGGTILISAKTASETLDHAINMTGIAQAQSVGEKNGEIIFSADKGVVHLSGTVDVSGKNAGEKGGKVTITGLNILVDGQTVIDASGYAGGGEVLIGGNYQGKGPGQNALMTMVNPGAFINVNALINGNGGKVIVWSDAYTQFNGNISAQGGVFGGDGGFVETSGHYLNVGGAIVNTLAPVGITGTWLLDPTNIYIALNQANATTAGMIGTNSSANTVSAGTFAATGGVLDSLLTTASLNTALTTSNVIVTTTNASGTGLGNITVVDAINWSSSANSLTLTAANVTWIFLAALGVKVIVE